MQQKEIGPALRNRLQHRMVTVSCACWLLASMAVAQPSAEPDSALMPILEQADSALAEGDLLAAQQAITSAYRHRDALQHPLLIEDYLFLLGTEFRESGSFELAYSAHADARDLSRRTRGLYNLDQIRFLQGLADSAQAFGAYEQAISLRRETVDLVVRAHGEFSFETVEATRRFADWLSENKHFGHAASEYYRASRRLNVIPAHDTADVVELLRRSSAHTLLASADEFGERLGPPSQLLRALEIVQPDLAAFPDPAPVRSRNMYPTPADSGPGGTLTNSSIACVEMDLSAIYDTSPEQPLLLSALLRDIGDWCMALDLPLPPTNPYRIAWDLLSLAEDGEQLREEWFGSPEPVHLAPFRSEVLSDDNDAPVGRIELRFTVNSRGIARRIRVVHSDPEGMVDQEAKQRIRNSRFRPRMQEGRPVTSEASHVFEFQYDPDSARR